MLIATFGPATGWAGKKISYESGTFMLEGHGAITAGDVMEYDRQAQLLWANDGTRAWVGSRAASATGTRSPAEKKATAHDMVSAWRLLMDGDAAMAMAILAQLAPEAWTDAGRTRNVLQLASKIRALDDDRFNRTCDELMATARTTLGRLGVTLDGVTYLGGHSDLGSPGRRGSLAFTTQLLDLIWTNGAVTLHKRLPMDSIARISIESGQVAQSRVLSALVFGVAGLGVRDSKDRTYLTAHTKKGESAVYEVDAQSATEVRVAITPVLELAHVPFKDESGPATATPEQAPASGLTQEIARLADLHDGGALTDQEFAALKAKLIE